ncbi:MAG: hypothetical protein WC454_08825 [Phycisphaerae bacterium]
MSVPEKVKIGWRTYEINQNEHKTSDNGKNDLWGEIDYDRNKIYIYEKQPEEVKPVTLLHEIVHGIFCLSGHSDWRDNEDLVNCIAENLYQVILDNPGLFGGQNENRNIDTSSHIE